MSSPEPTPLTGHVLVIDDEPAIGTLIEAAARRVGIRCTPTSTVEAFRTALSPDVTLVMVDLRMPRFDGIELLRELAASGCRARIALLSGFDRKVLKAAEDLARSLGLETAGRLQKPFRIADVEALLTGARGQPRGRPSIVAPAPRLARWELAEAIERDQVIMFYQPQISLATGRLTGLEALVRLCQPGQGLITPDRFITLAEEMQLINPLTELVLQHAMAEFSSLPAMAGLSLSVNLSTRSLVDLTFPEHLLPMAEACHVEPTQLIMEITESGLLDEMGTALDILARLRMKHVRLSIDDYGTGYSTMAQLNRVPATEMKIDRMFVRDMLVDASARALVERTIELGHDLDMVE